MKICIINYANGVFLNGQRRLADSLSKIGFTGDLLFFDELQPGWPTHEEAPWGFKPYAFAEAKKLGYDAALWIDAAGMVVRDLEPIWNIIQKQGVFAFSRRNSTVGEFCSDLALKNMKLTRADANTMPELSAFCIGINFKHPVGQTFLKQWLRFAGDGETFLGVRAPYCLADSLTNHKGIVSRDPHVKGHRHDQTVASVLVHRLKIPINTTYIFDLIGEARKGQTYADYIPTYALIVQNRDIKSRPYDFLTDLDVYINPLKYGRKDIYRRTLYRTWLRNVKDFIKFRSWQ